MDNQLPKKEEDIVIFLYNYILGRDPDPDSLVTYAEKLRNSELTPFKLAYLLYTSDENKNKREIFKTASDLSLYQFLLTLKTEFPILYKRLASIIADASFTVNDYKDYEPVDVPDTAQLVYTTALVPKANYEVICPNDKMFEYYRVNGYNVSKNIDLDKHYSLCVLALPELLDNFGTVVRELDKVCDRIIVNTKLRMKTYFESRSSKITWW